MPSSTRCGNGKVTRWQSQERSNFELWTWKFTFVIHNFLNFYLYLAEWLVLVWLQICTCANCICVFLHSLINNICSFNVYIVLSRITFVFCRIYPFRVFSLVPHSHVLTSPPPSSMLHVGLPIGQQANWPILWTDTKALRTVLCSRVKVRQYVKFGYILYYSKTLWFVYCAAQ